MKRRLLLLAALFWATPGMAEESAPVRVRAQAACSDSDAFFQEILARTPRARRANEGEDATRFDLTIEARDGKFRGELVVESAEGGRATRRVSAATCEDVSQALALVAALAIDPEAGTRGSAPEPAVAPTPTAPPAEPAPTVTSAPAVVSAPPRQEEPPEDHFQIFVGVGAEATGGAVPALGIGERALVGAGWSSPSVVSPTLWLSFARVTGHTETDLGRADMTLVAGRLEGCPVRLTLGPLSALPCGGAELGRLSGQGSGIRNPNGGAAWWAAATARGALELRPGAGLALALSGGALLPITRDHFVFVDAGAERLAFRPPPVAGFFGLSLTAELSP
ncbi:MAG: hypothetical protein KC776_11130 [Myxococcales bacterium]|nr:hypothetical protein [Myxococcales bacterium]MCB9578770.1 hypothetical protein [Polyangiaceae bacterium]